MNTSRWLLFLLVIVVTSVALSGCGRVTEENNPSKGASTSTEPITLSVYQINAKITDAEFEDYFVNPVKRKFPYITLQLIRNGPGSSPQDLVAAGTFPDIMFTDLSKQMRDLDLLYDLSDLVKKNNVDLKRFYPEAIDAIQKLDSGKLTSLPFSINYYSMFYNKDIFDKFGVGYPKDLMTWDEAIELAKKVSRVDGGTEYLGLDAKTPSFVGTQLSLPLVDPNTDKPLLDTGGWQKVFGMLYSLYKIPGNLPDIKLYNNGMNSFLKSRTLAMSVNFGVGMVQMLDEMSAKGDSLNWDMVTPPSFAEAPATSMDINLHVMNISKTSKYKDQAFQVISYVTSNEIQSLIVRKGRQSSLVSEDMQNNFGVDLPALKGKNSGSIFKTKFAKSVDRTDYDSIAVGKLNSHFKSALQGNSDINTALRQAQEEAEMSIQAALTQK